MSDNPAKVGNFISDLTRVTTGSPFRKVTISSYP
jgi:ABC transporter transmembrane region 2